MGNRLGKNPDRQDLMLLSKSFYRSGLHNQVFMLEDANYEGSGEYQGLIESLSFPVAIKIVVKAVDSTATSSILGRYIADRKSEIRYSRSMGDSERERIKNQIADLETMSERIGSKKSRLVESHTSFRISSTHPVKLRESSRNFTSLMKLMGFFTRPLRYVSSTKVSRMFSPFASVAGKYPMDTQSLTRIIPLAFTRIPDRSGVILGVDDTTEKPVFLDIFGKSSHNALIFGETGSGKSFFAKILLMRLATTGSADSIVIVDPLDEYFCRMFPGRCREIEVSRKMNFQELENYSEYEASAKDRDLEVTIYKISNLLNNIAGNEIESLLMHLYTMMTENEERKKIFLVDEAHLVIGNRNSLDALSRMVRHSRHYNSAVINVTQSVEDLSRDHLSTVISDNSSSVFIFRSRYLNNASRSRFGLSRFEDSGTDDLMGGKNSPYSECLMLGDGRMSRIRVLGTEFESKTIDEKEN